jgi:predicted metal-binding membrane protein
LSARTVPGEPLRPRRSAWRREQLSLLSLLLALSAASWAATERLMGGMDAGPGMDVGGLGFYVVAWVVMMAAMMFPSIAPMVLTYDRLRAAHRDRGLGAPADATAAFVCGYLVVWSAAGVAAYALFDLGRSLPGDALAWDRAGRFMAGGVVVAAAVYQLTPLKDACLTRCRGPLMFVLEHWRHGRFGALRMGVVHGAWCVGCCWALMASLFALGVMSLGWMLLVAVLIAIEKLLPWKRAANLGAATVLLVLGMAIIIDPGAVPGLSVPDDGGMDRMGGMGR